MPRENSPTIEDTGNVTLPPSRRELFVDGLSSMLFCADIGRTVFSLCNLIANPKQESQENDSPLIKNILSLAGSAATVAPIYFQECKEIFEFLQHELQGTPRVSAEDNGAEPLVDFHTQLDTGATLHVIGVVHSETALKNQRQFIEKAIAAADVYCTEHEEKNCPKPYFPVLSNAAFQKGKTVHCVDVRQVGGMTTALKNTLLANIESGLHIVQHSDLHSPITLPLWITRAMLVYLFWTTSIFQPFNQHQYNFSFVINARSAWMLKRTQAISKNFRGKNMLLVCGATHAEDIRYFIKNPQAFERRWNLYSNVYWSKDDAELATSPLPFQKAESGTPDPMLTPLEPGKEEIA